MVLNRKKDWDYEFNRSRLCTGAIAKICQSFMIQRHMESPQSQESKGDHQGKRH
jgi:hypothetical protein